jgi:hypothetical protein
MSGAGAALGVTQPQPDTASFIALAQASTSASSNSTVLAWSDAATTRAHVLSKNVLGSPPQHSALRLAGTPCRTWHSRVARGCGGVSRG